MQPLVIFISSAAYDSSEHRLITSVSTVSETTGLQVAGGETMRAAVPANETERHQILSRLTNDINQVRDSYYKCTKPSQASKAA